MRGTGGGTADGGQALRSTAAPAEDPTARRSLIVSGWTLASRVGGLARVLVLGATLGPTLFANGVQTALVVPNLVFTVVAGSLVMMTVIPALVRVGDDAGQDRAVEVLGRISARLLLAAACCALALACASHLVARLLSLGVHGPQAAQVHRSLTLLVILVSPQIVLYVVAALGVAAQQARGRFALAAAAPAVENAVVVAGVLLADVWFGPVRQLGNAPVGFVVAVGIASTAAVAAHAAIQVTGAARAGLRVRPRPGLKGDADALAAARRLRGSVGVAAFPSAGLGAMLLAATTVPGGVLLMQVAYQLFAALSYLGPRAVSMVVLPLLSAVAGRSSGRAYAAAWHSALFYTVAAALPALVLLAVFARPTADLLFWFEGEQAVLLGRFADCLLVVAVAQLVGGLHDVGRQALFARLEHRVPARASACALAAVLLTCAVSPAFDGAHRPLVLTGAVLLSEGAAAAVVLARLRTTLKPEPLLGAPLLWALAVGAVTLVPAALAGRWVLAVVAPAPAATLGMLLVIGPVALVAYAVVLRRVIPRLGVGAG
ncbi:lipid II flippase MurJ [Streptomyces sp. NBC_00588]|uniref:lipid II flippase MurJ n=1 Tax=Streptomyces sp. NBC_00588 TaxID=2975784 RepID=UPI002E7FEB16|nr:lipid II flippase MurJ [Streptomyces sp. NBC_00588]WUB40105.1 hypothetical protein OHN38_36260 [Streptomyces sp. NBC_00588]